MVLSASSVCRDGLEDPLDDTGLVQQQLDQLSTIGRCEYEKTCALLVQLFDQSAQSYQELLQSATAIPVDIAVQEGTGLEGCGISSLSLSLSPSHHPQLFLKGEGGSCFRVDYRRKRILPPAAASRF